MTPQQIEAMKLALEALKKCRYRSLADEIVDPAITSLEEVLAEHSMRETQRLGQEIEQEPCVHAKNPKGCYRVRCQLGDNCVDDEMSFRTAPPQRTWVGLTDEDWNRSKHNYDFQKGVDWAESILKQKNGYAEEKNT